MQPTSIKHDRSQPWAYGIQDTKGLTPFHLWLGLQIKVPVAPNTIGHTLSDAPLCSCYESAQTTTTTTATTLSAPVQCYIAECGCPGAGGFSGDKAEVCSFPEGACGHEDRDNYEFYQSTEQGCMGSEGCGVQRGNQGRGGSIWCPAEKTSTQVDTPVLCRGAVVRYFNCDITRIYHTYSTYSSV